jgi:hypothetical protein
MAKKKIRRFSTSLAIKEMKIKTNLRFNIILVKMAIITNTTKMLVRMWGKGIFMHC